MTPLPPALIAECEAFMRARARVLWPTGVAAGLWLAILHWLVPSAWSQAGAWLGLLLTFGAVVGLTPSSEPVASELRRRSDPAATRMRRRLFGVRGWFDPATGAIAMTPLWVLLAYRAVFGF